MRANCPICQSKNKSILKRIKLTIPEYFHLPDKYDIVVCEDCGFCYAATEATLEDYNYYYSHCNPYSGTPTASKGKMEFNQKAIELVKRLADKDSYLLDMGYGQGNFMHLLQKSGFNNIYGIDPSSDSVMQMQNQGFTVYQSSIFDKVRADLQGKFDFVFLFDVLEHLLYPDRAIENVSDYLKESGYLVIGIPNYADLFEDNSILTNQFNQEHINYFSPLSIDNILYCKNFDRVTMEKLEIAGSSELLVIARYNGKKTQNSQTEPEEEISYLRDEICRKSIESYLHRNDKLAQTCNEKLYDFTKDSAPPSIYIWGTGAYVMWLLSNTSLGKMKIEAFVDNNPTKIGKELIERPIICAENVKNDYPIIICCMRHSQEIVTQMKNANMINDYMIL